MGEPSPLRALLNPVAAATLVVGAGVGAALHSPPLAALGALTWLALVTWEWMGPRSPATASEDVVLPSPDTVADPELRALAAELRTARDERRRVFAETPEAVAQGMASAIRSCADLERNAAVLIARGEDLARWLGTQNEAETRADEQRLAARAASARDPAARAGYARAQTAREEHRQAVRDVADARERICAHLSRIAATLSSVPPKLVRMRAMDAEAMDLVGTEVARDLLSLDDEVRLFERTLQSLNQGTP